MLTSKCVLVIIAVSCTSAAPVQDSFNVTVKRFPMEAGDDVLGPFPEPEEPDNTPVDNVPASSGLIANPRSRDRTPTTKKPKKNQNKFKAVVIWPNGIVPYIMDTMLNSTMQDIILSAMREIEESVNGRATTCVKFQLREQQANYLKINAGPECQTFVGLRNQGEQVLSLNQQCEQKAVIMHELLHVLGFYHEHVRHDRDKYIRINKSNMEKNKKEQFAKVPKRFADTLNISYDFGSIMHYGPYTNAKNPAVPVITLKKDQDKEIMFGQRDELSHWDVIRIQRRYGCTEDASHRTTLPDSLFSCNFAKDMCRFKANSTGQVRWTVKSGRSKAGPMAGNSNGADSYLLAVPKGKGGTAHLFTTFLMARTYCVNFAMFQKGPSSYLNVLHSGPSFSRRVLATYERQNTNAWIKTNINVEYGGIKVFQIEFEAKLSSGDVAIDDINIRTGACR